MQKIYPNFPFRLCLAGVLLFQLLAFNVEAQNGVLIDYVGTTRDNSAILDVRSTNQGVLVPRLSFADRNAIASPATGLLIYQTDVVAGYYYNNGTAATPAWTRIIDSTTNSDNQNLSSTTSGTNRTINISGGTGTTISVADNDNDAANELQTLGLSGNTLSISGTNSVNLASFVNTDNQNLSNSVSGTNRTINISGGTGTTINVADNDNDAANEIQTLSISGSTISLTGGGSVIVPSSADNLGNHSATTTLSMNNNLVSGYGRLVPYGVGANSGQGADAYSIYQEAGAWTFPFPDLMIRHHTGIKMSAEGSYGGIKLYATNGEGLSAAFDNSGLTLSSLAGAGTRVVVADAAGLLTTQTIASMGDNLGNHTATANLNMSNFEVDNVNYLDMRPGNGYGLRFWSSDLYKIHMGNAAEYLYGPVTDYSIKMNMGSGVGRGFTWGQSGVAPIAALNSTSGNMQIAGTFHAGTSAWAANQLHFSSGWTTAGVHATIGSGYTGISAAGIMLGSPHVPWRASYGAKMRYASDQAATTYWDLGMNGEGGGSADRFDLNRGTTNFLTVNNNGYLGIGTTNPSFKLHVPSGYIGTDYINTTDNAVSSGVTGIMVKQGDNYHRTSNAAGVLSFLGVTAPTGDNLGNHTATTTLNLQGNLVTGSGGTVLDGGGGWHRTYGQTGWFNGTYASGMCDHHWRSCHLQ